MQKYIHLTFQIGFKTEDKAEEIQEVGEAKHGGRIYVTSLFPFWVETFSIWLIYSSDSGPQLLIVNRLGMGMG